ncbi:hypothetical protein [Thauera humireducens]|uniref:hypothetical protein n=1 Tax=Thauera humireducens TaxID=1134435 RepID=UPI003C75C8A1
MADEFSRLGRNPRQQLEILERLDSTQVRLICADGIDSANSWFAHGAWDQRGYGAGGESQYELSSEARDAWSTDSRIHDGRSCVRLSRRATL